MRSGMFPSADARPRLPRFCSVGKPAFPVILRPVPSARACALDAVIARSPTQTSLARRLSGLSSLFSRREALPRYCVHYGSHSSARGKRIDRRHSVRPSLINSQRCARDWPLFSKGRRTSRCSGINAVDCVPLTTLTDCFPASEAPRAKRIESHYCRYGIATSIPRQKDRLMGNRQVQQDRGV
ncbi:hypothetical protein VTN02DRAFT_3731 [Thermoascus thermophilus]